jgi:hypothetical protein
MFSKLSRPMRSNLLSPSPRLDYFRLATIQELGRFGQPNGSCGE